MIILYVLQDMYNVPVPPEMIVHIQHNDNLPLKIHFCYRVLCVMNDYIHRMFHSRTSFKTKCILSCNESRNNTTRIALNRHINVQGHFVLKVFKRVGPKKKKAKCWTKENVRNCNHDL